MFTLEFQEKFKENYQKSHEQLEKLKVGTCFSHTCQTLSKNTGALGAVISDSSTCMTKYNVARVNWICGMLWN